MSNEFKLPNIVQPGEILEGKKKMPWQETMNKLESAVQDAQEKESKLNEVTAEFNEAKKEYSEAVNLVESLRQELTNTVGQLFATNPRVTVSQ